MFYRLPIFTLAFILILMSFSGGYAQQDGDVTLGTLSCSQPYAQVDTVKRDQLYYWDLDVEVGQSVLVTVRTHRDNILFPISVSIFDKDENIVAKPFLLIDPLEDSIFVDSLGFTAGSNGPYRLYILDDAMGDLSVDVFMTCLDVKALSCERPDGEGHIDGSNWAQAWVNDEPALYPMSISRAAGDLHLSVYSFQVQADGSWDLIFDLSDPNQVVTPLIFPDNLVLVTRKDGVVGTTTGDYTVDMPCEAMLSDGYLSPDAQSEMTGRVGGDDIQEGQEDYYTLMRYKEGQEITIELNRTEGNLQAEVEVLDADGNVVAKATAGSDGKVTLKFTIDANGPYTIRVGRAGGPIGSTKGAYILKVIAGPVPSWDTGKLACCCPVEGGITEQDPIDDWVFNGQAGEKIIVSLTRKQGNLDPLVSLYDAQGNLLTRAFDETGMGDITFVYILPADGIYWLSVRHFCDEITTGTYTLMVGCADDICCEPCEDEYISPGEEIEETEEEQPSAKQDPPDQIPLDQELVDLFNIDSELEAVREREDEMIWSVPNGNIDLDLEIVYPEALPAETLIIAIETSDRPGAPYLVDNGWFDSVALGPPLCDGSVCVTLLPFFPEEAGVFTVNLLDAAPVEIAVPADAVPDDAADITVEVRVLDPDATNPDDARTSISKTYVIQVGPEENAVVPEEPTEEPTETPTLTPTPTEEPTEEPTETPTPTEEPTEESGAIAPQAPGDGGLGIAWTTDGLLMSSNLGGSINFWDPDDYSLQSGFETPGVAFPMQPTLSPDGTMVAAISSMEGFARVWNAANGKELHTVSQMDGTVALAWSQDGTKLAAGSMTGEVLILNTSNWSTAQTLNSPAPGVRALAWYNHYLAVATSDDIVRIWDVDAAEIVKELDSRIPEVNAMTWWPSIVLAIATGEGRVFSYMSPDHILVDSFGKVFEAFHAAAWSPDASRLAVAGVDGVVWVLRQKNQRQWEEVTLLEGPGGAIESLAWSPDSNRLAALVGGETVHIWDVPAR